MTRKIVGAVAAGVIAFGLAGAAYAGPFVTATQTQSFHFGTLSGLTLLSFDGFDSNLGTLESVHISLSADITVNDTAAVVPNGSGNQSVGVPTPLTASSFSQLVGPGSLFVSTGVVTTPGFVGTVIDDNVVHVVGTVTSTVNGSTVLNSPPTDLSAYIGGTGSVALVLTQFGTQGGSVSDFVLTGNTGTADVLVSLFYDYSTTTTNMPEPTTLVILGLGLAGLGIARRRRV